LFFCLSGFVLTKAYSRRIQKNLTLVQFVKLRLIRLYPLFLVGLLLGLIAVSINTAAGTSDYTWRDLTEGFVLNLAVLSFPNHGAITIMNGQQEGMIFLFNNPNWSLFFELAANLSIFAFIKMRMYSIRHTMWVVLLSFLCFGLPILAGLANYGWGPRYFALRYWAIRTTFCFYSGVLMAAGHGRLNVQFKYKLSVCNGHCSRVHIVLFTAPVERAVLRCYSSDPDCCLLRSIRSYERTR
jgi:peptidoglycan/LPS O-acetylase OafA/YrhL